MSVYTQVERSALAAWLAPLGVGAFQEHVGIAAGMQNSNYFVHTDAGRWVLTLFEHLAPEAVDFYIALQAHLADRGIPCPRPLSADGRLWRYLAGKPAALFTCLPGTSIDAPLPAHCRTLGEVLAEMHLAAIDFPNPQPNPCGAKWRAEKAELLAPRLSLDERERLLAEIAFQSRQDYADLPGGVIHADLFRDNALWSGDRLTGVLDFYFAGTDAWLFDLAVVANDWCTDGAALAALLEGYGSRRAFAAAERSAWVPMRRAAALRFWLLRLEAREFPRPGSVVTVKDPDHFGELLRQLCLADGEMPG